jgi:maltooligosyltrehalose trehalohydrolase
VTFHRCKLQRELRRQGRHRALEELYRELIRLRRELPALAVMDRENLEADVYEREKLLLVRCGSGAEETWLVFFFGTAGLTITLPLPQGRWRKLLDTAESRWLGEGSTVPAEIASAGEVQVTLNPESCILLARTKEA